MDSDYVEESERIRDAVLRLTPAEFQAGLHESLEDCLDAVWAAERDWRTSELISARLRYSVGGERLA